LRPLGRSGTVPPGRGPKRGEGDDTDAGGGAENLERKVHCGAADLAAIRARLDCLGVPVCTLAQRDTYFAAARGRLKLRRIAEEHRHPEAELIAYHRPTESGSRWSAYHRIPVAAEDAAALEAALSETVGTLVVVAKTRAVGIVGQTRVHLDDVDRLGAFVELETVVADGDRAAAEAAHAAVVAVLGLERFAPVAGSYADLMLESNEAEQERA